MFEKEAKERAKDFTDNKERQVAYECGFLDGADRMRAEMQKLEEDKFEVGKTYTKDTPANKRKVKAWYDDIDAATLQRIKTYSAFNDAKSKNLMMQTMYEYREKEIQDFKETNHELAETCIERKKRIAELEKENAELKEKLAGAERTRDNLRQIGFPTFQSCKEYADKLNYAKAIIKDLLDNSDEYTRQRAMDFLKEKEND